MGHKNGVLVFITLLRQPLNIAYSTLDAMKYFQERKRQIGVTSKRICNNILIKWFPKAWNWLLTC